jgi:hypothetical protein
MYLNIGLTSLVSVKWKAALICTECTHKKRKEQDHVILNMQFSYVIMSLFIQVVIGTHSFLQSALRPFIFLLMTVALGCLLLHNRCCSTLLRSCYDHFVI